MVDPAGVVRYAGGYTARKQGLELRDRQILGDLMASGTTPLLPLYGCAVSKRLQAILDPIGIKYGTGPVQGQPSI